MAARGEGGGAGRGGRGPVASAAPAAPAADAGTAAVAGPAAPAGTAAGTAAAGAPGGAAALWAAGRRAWPRVAVAPEELERHVRALHAHATDELVGGGALDGAGLYLACGCARGDAAALRAFDEEVLPRARQALDRLRLDSSERDEILQRLRVRLLVADAGRPPRIAEFEGRGALVKWVQVAAVRLALNARREAQQRRGLAVAAALVPEAAASPESGYLKTSYAPVVADALRAAAAALSERGREVLRLRYCEQLGEEQIAARLGVHRVTVARWVRAARLALLQQLRRRLASSLALDRRDLDSLIGDVRSRIDVSVASVLRTPG